MITIRDNISTLTAEQTQSLRDKSNAYPFDLYVTIGGAVSRDSFKAEVASHVGANTVSIGVDPNHRFTFVKASAKLGLPDGPAVASAGNAYFKRADLVGGIDAIAGKANELRVTTRVEDSATGAPIIVHEQPMATGWWWGLGGLGAVVLGVGVWAWWSKQQRERALARTIAEYNNATGDALMAKAERNELEDFDRRLKTTERAARPAKSYRPPPQSSAPSYYPPPAAAPVVVQQSNNDLITGMVIGELISTPRETVVIREEAPASRSSSSSYSSSSSSSDSSSSSSWSSLFDSSSSSSWDSGGGFDSGSSSGSDW